MKVPKELKDPTFIERIFNGSVNTGAWHPATNETNFLWDRL